jgi:hypothetical protein
VTDAGTVRNLLLSEIETVRLAGAAELSVTVHVALPPEESVAGVHSSEVSVTGGVRLSEAIFALPFNAAVTVAVCGVAIVPAAALNVPLVAPAAMVTEAGTVSVALSSETVTRLPPAGATALSVTVQVAAAPDDTEVGLQASPLSWTRVEVILTEAVFDVPLAEADTVTVAVAVTVPAVAAKAAVALPAATVTERGTVRYVLLSETATTTPPVGATLLIVTVHVLEAPDGMEDGLHANPLI